MRKGMSFSRRAVLALTAALGLSTLLSGVAEAKRPVNIQGEWVGVLSSKEFGEVPFTADITSQKKNGKFSGTAAIAGQKPVPVKGKISPKRKVKAIFDGSVNGEPVTYRVRVTATRDGNNAAGTFDGRDEKGNVLINGTVTMERISE
jgi:hypothetical protein